VCIYNLEDPNIPGLSEAARLQLKYGKFRGLNISDRNPREEARIRKVKKREGKGNYRQQTTENSRSIFNIRLDWTMFRNLLVDVGQCLLFLLIVIGWNGSINQ
jgi:hypothetical protein